MTLIAGFTCKDGVVMCADTELTMSGWMKYSGSKIRSYNKLRCHPVFCFSGDERFCNTFISKLAIQISRAESADKPIVKAIEDEAFYIHKRFKGEPYEEDSALILSLIFGGKGKGRRRLCEISRGIVSPVEQSCLGSGALVTRAMIAELFSPELSMKDVALLATYLLAEGKTYGYGVGQESQILLLSHAGWWTPFPDDPFYPNVKEIEGDYMGLKKLLRPIIAAYSDVEIDKDKFAKILEEFGRDAAQRREKRISAYKSLVQQDMEHQAELFEAYIEEHLDSEPNSTSTIEE